MAIKRAIEIDTLDRLAKGFQESRGITDKLTTEQMIAFANEPVASGDNKFLALVDDTLTEITSEDFEGATKIRDYIFYRSSVRGNITFPNSVTTIGNYAFNNSGIESINTGEVQTIGQYTFGGCRSMTSLYLSDSLTSIGHTTFQSCSNLTQVRLSQNAQFTTLPYNAFQYCSKLKNLTIPSNITNINSSALDIGGTVPGDKATITFLSTIPPTISTSTFSAVKLEKIIVPAGSGEAYKTATNWANFADYIEEAAV